MAKLTRKSYKRKKIAFAAVILGGVALVSSGFAAWVLSANATKDASGVTTVGQVKDNSLTMSIDLQYLVHKDENDATGTWTKQEPAGGVGIATGTFDFDPTYKDVRKAGQRIYNDGKNFERLTLRYVVTVTSKDAESFDKLTVKMEETISGRAASKVKSAVDKNYVIAPTCFTAEGETVEASNERFKKVDKTKSTDVADADKLCTWTTNYDVSFKWGSFFSTTGEGEGINPGDYFDSPAGLDKYKVLGTVNDTMPSDKTQTPTVSAILNDLHETLDSASYKLTFTASAK